MKNCLKCKELDTSDIPNVFCKISCELVNETEFRYCPKNPKSVVEFIEKLEETHKKEIQELQAKVNELEEGIKNNKTANTSKLVELFDNENKQLKHQLQAQRKQTVKTIKDLAGDYFEFDVCEQCGKQVHNDVILTGKDLTEILDRVERGENESYLFSRL